MDVALAAPMTPAEPLDDDARLLRAFAELGEREALAELLRRHLEACWRLALRLSGNAADAEDILQEATLIAMRQARRWRGGSVKAWLLGIVANAQRDHARSARRRERRERSSPPPEPEPERDDDLREAAVAALAELPDAYRAPVCLRYLEGLEFPDIASALGLGERTARTRVSRGLERLREMLAPHRAGIAAEGVAALIVSVPTPPAPATVPAAVMKTAATGPLAATATAPVVVGAAIAAALAILGVFGAHPWQHAMAAAPSAPAAAGDASDARSDVDRALDLRLDLALYHVTEPVLAIRNLLPPGTVIPYAFPFTDDRLPWTGATVVGNGIRVRDYLDQASAQLGLTWEVDDGYVLFFRPMRDADRAADLAELRDPKSTDAQRREAADRLAWSRDRTALRALLLAMFGAEERAAAAADHAVSTAYGTPWPTSRRGTAYHAFRGDREVVDAAAATLKRVDGGAAPWLLYLGGILKAPGAEAALAAAAAKDFTAHPSAREATHLAAMRAATAIAAAEVGAAWDTDPEVARIAAEDVPTVRIACAHAWARRGDPRAVPALTALWRLDEMSEQFADILGAATVEARARCPNGAAIVPALIAVIGEARNMQKCDAATAALAEMRDPAAIEPLVRILADERAPGFEYTFGILFSAPPEPALAALRKVADSASPELRARALGVMLTLGERSALEPLAAIAAADPPIPASRTAAMMLTRPEFPEAVDHLAKLALTSENGLGWIAAARTPRAVGALTAVLRDRTQPMKRRLLAAQQLGFTRDVQAGTALGRQALVIAEDDALRHACIDDLIGMHCPVVASVLGAIDRRGGSPPSFDAAGSPRFPTRTEAAACAERLKAAPDAWRAQAIAALADLYLNDPSLPDDDALQALRRALLEDPLPAVRKAAADQLANLAANDDRATIVALGHALRSDIDGGVRRHARASLENARSGIEGRSRVDALHLGGGVPDLSALDDIAKALDPAEEPPVKGKTDF